MRPLRPLLTIAALSLAALAAAQMPGNWKDLNVSRMPESQVKAYAAKMVKAGYTLEDVTAKAREKGASEAQVTAIEKRFGRYVKRAKIEEPKSAQDQRAANAANLDNLAKLADKVKVEYDTRIFGSDIFNRQGLNFAANANVSVPESYLLGVGDQLLIDVTGTSEAQYNVAIEQNGCIQVPGYGPINVGGLPLDAARNTIQGRLRSIFGDIGHGSVCNIRIGQVRPVNVSVVGEVYVPGTFTVSATATLFNVLYMAGGPSRTGSMRDVQLLRGGRLMAHLDLYDFLIGGQADCNPGLRDGDIVLVPPYQKRVKVGGPFKRQGLFEAKEGETVQDLIDFAGGFDEFATEGHLGLFRIGKKYQEFLDVSQKRGTLLANGDSLHVGSITDVRVANAISVVGAVFAEGDYECTPGLTLGRLIAQAGGLTENAFLPRCVIQRLKDDYTLETLNYDLRQLPDSASAGGPGDLPLKSGDVITINSINDMRDQRMVTITGAIRMPGDYEYADHMTLGDLIVLSQGLTDLASTHEVEVLRRLPVDSLDSPTGESSTVSTVSITRTLETGDAGNDFALEPADQVFVRELSGARLGGNITLTGALRTTGTFGLSSNQTRLSTIISRAGGFTNLADPDGARIIRKVNITERERQILMRKGINELGDTLFYLKDDSLSYELVAINLEKALRQPGSKEDIFMLDGDELIVPERSLTVRVSGNVQSPTSLTYIGGQNVRRYIRQAGGFGLRSSKKQTYVIHANGQSERAGHFLFFRRYPRVTPGCELVAVRKPERVSQASVVVPVVSSLVSLIGVVAVALLK